MLSNADSQSTDLEIRLPPGPPGSWRPTLQLIRNPRAALESWVKEYGDPFLLTALNGPVVVTGREDLIRTIHGQDPSIYAPFAMGTYTEPELFRPERFIDHSYSAFEYMPFGGGHRRCIGAAFASYEMAIVLGTILKRYQLELVDSNLVVPKRRNVTIGPSSGVPIRVNKR